MQQHCKSQWVLAKMSRSFETFLFCFQQNKGIYVLKILFLSREGHMSIQSTLNEGDSSG